MNWGSFGDTPFTTTYSPSQIQSNRSWRYAAHNLVAGYPQHEFVAEAEHKISLGIELNKQFIDPMSAYIALTEVAEKGQPQSLMIGSDYIGEFAINSIQETLHQTNLEGQAVHMSLQLSLIEVRE